MIEIVCKHAWDLVYSGQTDGRTAGQSSLKIRYTAMPVSLQWNKQTILWRHIHSSIAHQPITLKTLTPAAEYWVWKQHPFYLTN